MLDPARRDREDDEAGREVRSDRVTTRQGPLLLSPPAARGVNQRWCPACTCSAQTTHPSERRPQTTQRRNMRPWSQQTLYSWPVT
jgi:hypothetical protein